MSKLLEHPLPTLTEFIGDGARADEFYEWAAEQFVIGKALQNEDEKAALRILHILLVAMTEGCRIETDRHGRDHIDTCRLVARMAGYVVASPLISILRDDAPLKEVRQMLLDELTRGLDLMIDGAIAQQATADIGDQQ